MILYCCIFMKVKHVSSIHQLKNIFTFTYITTLNTIFFKLSVQNFCLFEILFIGDENETMASNSPSVTLNGKNSGH